MMVPATARPGRPRIEAAGGGILRTERGFALIGALLVMVLVTALGSAAIFLAQLDLMLAGNYRVQRAAEASADGALDLVKAMIFGNTLALNLPLSIPSTNAAALAWRAGPDTNGDGVGDGITYTDSEIDVAVTIKYKQEDAINYNTGEIFPDEVVRYGRDYNFESAQKAIGRQPVFFVTFRDNRTGVKAEADLISTIGFRTPAALFCGGAVHMQKYQWATEESIEVISGNGTPAVATASANASVITIETVKESTSAAATTLSTAAAANATSLAVANTAGFCSQPTPTPSPLHRFRIIVDGNPVTYAGKATSPARLTGCQSVLPTLAGRPVSVFKGTTLSAAAITGDATVTVTSTAGFINGEPLLIGNAQATCTGKDATHFTGCSGVLAAAAGTIVNIKNSYACYDAVNPTANNEYAVNSSYLHQRVYRPAEVEASKVAGLYSQARDSTHILLGVGDRLADLTAAAAAAGGGSAGATAANALFRFYNRSVDSASSVYDLPIAFAGTPQKCEVAAGVTGVVCYNYQMPAAQAPLTQLETMFGQSFADLKSLADQVYTCTTPVTLPTGGNSNYGCNWKDVNLGSPGAPQVVYVNGTGNSNPVSLVTCDNPPSTTTCGQVAGFGILIIDGDADIVGSINWQGLMLIKGNLQFRPYQGGTNTLRSDATLATQWNGFIIIGGDLDLWTYWGGSIILGYSSSDAARVKGIISSTLPHKVLSWRRSYN